MRASRVFPIVLISFLIVLPGTAYAQASIAGTVRDTSGAVLPGVTVEASSPELIERFRTVVSDGNGQYRIVDLRPGTYAVSFTLPGFNTVRRPGIELSGTFTATVNVEMRVGDLEETITVTGESPIVDVQSARRQQVIERDALTSIPSSRSYHNIAALVPGITVGGSQDVGGIVGPSVVTFSGYGGRAGEGRLQVDGVGVGGNTAGTSYYVADLGNAQEVTITTSGGMGEAEVGGPIINVVPQTGGNTLRGSLFATGANGAMQSDNYTQELRDLGLTNPASLIKIWDLNGSVGGPIRRDRLWFFATTRYHGNRKYIENMYYNANAGNPSAWGWVPDLSRPALSDSTWKNTSVRLTWQASSRNKLNLFWDEQRSCLACIGGGSATVSPEAADGTTNDLESRAPSVTWTSTVTNRLLLEAGWGFLGFLYGAERQDNNRDLVRVVEQGGQIPGLTYRSMIWQRNQSFTPRYRASASYVTGAHSVKVGVDGLNFWQMRTYLGNNQSLNYRLNNGVPNQLTMFVNDFRFRNRTNSFAFYAQNQSTLGRLTVQAGLRYDHASSFSPEQQVGPDRFIPDRIVFPRQVMVAGYHDISPRLGAAFDVFGTGKTSVRVNLGRYVEAAQSGGRYTASNPIFTSIGGGVPPSTTRAWTDANGNFTPDCNLLNPAGQDLRAAGGDFCGPLANQSFGQVTNPSILYDPELLRGWGVRADDWQFGVSVQQELLPRFSVEVGYLRRWYGNFEVTDNLLVQPSDYDEYSITVPSDPRLPGGGGYVIGDLWNISPAKFGQTQNFITAASNFGDQIQYWHGVDVNLRLRFLSGLTFQGGTSTGRQVEDSCDVIVDNPSRRNCRVTLPFQTTVRGLASYTIPKIDVQVSGTLQSRPGSAIAANLVVPSATVAQTLGRPLSGGAANVTINVLDPGQMYRDRINEIDFRVGKILRFGRTRANIGVDLFNALNSSAVQNSIATFGATWLRPTLVMPARFAKVSAQIDF
jgi:hypothetical protein